MVLLEIIILVIVLNILKKNILWSGATAEKAAVPNLAGCIWSPKRLIKIK
jgi:hypothetical protein